MSLVFSELAFHVVTYLISAFSLVPKHFNMATF